jgi:16S rRNA (cytosine967-C5)-methyltransferase
MKTEAAGPGAAPKSGAPLSQVLPVCAGAWLRWRAGRSLDAALQEAAREAPDEGGPDAARAGAARALTTAAVRRHAMVEFILARLVHRPPEAPVQALLAIALAQLLARSYAEFTLVDQTVRAARARPGTAAAAGLVNAVLRAFLRRRAELEEQARADPARRWNLPPWWLAKLQAEYGPRCELLLEAQLEEPPLVLRVNVRRAAPAAMLERLRAEGLEACRIGAGGIRLRRALPVERIPGFREGLLSVQDAGAQLAAPWLGASAGMRVLDACAAPGGKTAHLLEIADCALDAIECDAERAGRIRANLQRLGLDEAPAGASGAAPRVIVGDVLRVQEFWDGRPYERILLDAPCTASGVLRRHPDAAWLRRPEDVANLATQQGKMLRGLWPLLARAGRLLYVVCSVFPEEGRRQIDDFLRREPGARALALPVAGSPGGSGGVQLLPSSAPWPADAAGDAEPAAVPSPHDGFFYALIEKI